MLDRVLGPGFPAVLFAALIVPPILSRCRALSVGRWVVLAVLAAGVGFGGVVYLLLIFEDRGGRPGPDSPAGVMATALGLAGFLGCMVAAAIHPKGPPR